MKKNITVSIGIPAYNEEANIKKMLQSLLSQNESGFRLEEIIVVSDGSTDNTIKKVREIKDKRIVITDDTKRIGKSARMNQIFKSFHGDILFLADADIVIKDKNILAKIIKNTNFEKSGIVSVHALPFPATTFIEHVLEAGVGVAMEIAKEWNGGKNYLAFKGCFLGIEGELAKSLRLSRRLVNNDAYLYFAALKKGYTPHYFSNLYVFYNSPNTFTDHLKQSSRYQSSRQEMEQFFAHDLREAYKTPFLTILASLRKYAFTQPIHLVLYGLINVYTKIKKDTHTKSTWKIATSTKGGENHE